MSFDLLAPHYRWMEALLAGGVLQRARTAHLEKLSGTESVLIVGEGPGRLLEAMLPRFPTIAVTILEASAAMGEVARKRLSNLDTSNVTWITADVLDAPLPSAAFDVVITPFVLDCFTASQLPRVISRLARAAKPKAQWLLADFQVPAVGWKKWRARMVHRTMYLFFNYVTRLPARRVTPPDDFLRAEGFHLEERREFNAALIRSDRWVRRSTG